jgi:DGQHR domain-containing protein
MSANPRSRSFTYQALEYSQSNNASSPTFLIFHAAARDIVDWADVDRLQPENRKGAQRPLRELKVNKVAQFLAANPRNTIPTSVVIALDSSAVTFNGKSESGGAGKHGTLKISMAGSSKPGLIIDGQHRVYGAAKFSATTQLNVVAFLGGDDAERAFQFVVINNSGARVSQSHIKALNLNFDKAKLNSRLIQSAGLALGLDDEKYDDLQAIDATQPFKGLLAMPTNPGGFITPNAIESALAETKDRSALLGIEDLERDVFLAIWSTIKKLRPAVWTSKSRLLQKVSIYALTVYVLDSMIARQRNSDDPIDFTEVEVLHKQVERLVGRIPEMFWATEWTEKGLDTSSGRAKVVEALQLIDSNVRFHRHWYDSVSFIDPALLANAEEDSRAVPAKRKSLKSKKAAKGQTIENQPTTSKAGKKIAKATSKVVGKKKNSGKLAKK